VESGLSNCPDGPDGPDDGRGGCADELPAMSAQRCPGAKWLRAPAVRNGPAGEAADWTGGAMSGGESHGSRLFSPTVTVITDPARVSTVTLYLCECVAQCPVAHTAHTWHCTQIARQAATPAVSHLLAVGRGTGGAFPSSEGRPYEMRLTRTSAIVPVPLAKIWPTTTTGEPTGIATVTHPVCGTVTRRPLR
jgi:hypothetical protein